MRWLVLQRDEDQPASYVVQAYQCSQQILGDDGRDNDQGSPPG
jgi:hypothetical protein